MIVRDERIFGRMRRASTTAYRNAIESERARCPSPRSFCCQTFDFNETRRQAATLDEMRAARPERQMGHASSAEDHDDELFLVVGLGF